MHKYDLNLREYWRIVKRRKLIIIFTMVVMGIFSFISAILGKPVPIYKVSATVQLQKSPSPITGGNYADFQFPGGSNAVETQTHVIKSYFTMELTAKKMGLIPADLSPEEVRQNSKYVNIIIDLQERVQTEQRGSSNLIDITVTANEPKFVTNFCNTLTDIYRTQHTLDLNRRTIESKKFIESQFSISKDKLSKAEEAVKQFREASKWTTMESEVGSVSGQINRLQDLYSQNAMVLQKVNSAERLLAGAESTPLGSDKSFYFDEAPPPYKVLNDRLVNLMVERDTLLLTYTDDFPQVRAVKAQIRENVANMRTQLRAQKKNLENNIRNVQQQLTQLEARLKALPEKNLEFTRLMRDLEIAKELYSLLEKKYQEALIVEAEKVEEVKIVKPAIEPIMPINPPRVGTNTVLGTLLGLILGVVFAFLIETFDTSIGAIEEVEEFLGVHVMGIIPFVSYEEIKTLLSDGQSGEIEESKLRRYARLASHFVPSSTLSESYKALRTSLNFLCTENNVKTILFTSSSPGEGKTSIVVNVAITMAQTGQKVLLIDGDLRRPVVSKLFGIEQVPGLTDVVLGNYEWHKVVRGVADFITGKMSIEDIMKTPGMDNLNIITSGTYSPNPAEIINSRAIGEFLGQIRQEYDVILVDAPPVLAATDAALWSSRVDGSVLVYQVGKIARGALKRSKISLENLKANVLGVVLNGLKAEISPDFGQDYYYYYSHQDKEEATVGKRIGDALLKGPLGAWSFVRNLYARAIRRKPSGAEAPQATGDLSPEALQDTPPNAQEETPRRVQTGDMKESDPEMEAIYAAAAGKPEKKRRRKKSANGKLTPAWLKFLMVGALVLLLAFGLYYQFNETKNQKVKRVSFKQQIGGNSFRPPVKKPEAALNAVPPGQPKPAEVKPLQPFPAPAPSGPAPAAAVQASPLPPKPAQSSAVSPTAAQASRTAGAPAVAPAGDKGAAPNIVKPFTVQVKSVPTPEEAGRIVAELKGKGEEAYSRRVYLKSRGEWNRVFIGRFASKDEAVRFIRERKLEEKFPGSIVQKAPES